MKIEIDKKGTPVKVSDIGIGEAFIYNDDLWIRLPKFDGGPTFRTIFKEEIFIPAWNVTQDNTSHFTENCIAMPVDSTLIIKYEL